jgi:uncharacterized phage-associated protein
MNAHDVAAAVIADSGHVHTLKLQKLMFLAAGEYLALTGETLFPEPIEAWDNGPVVRTVWKTYRDSEGASPIREPLSGDPVNLNPVARACVASVVERYGHMTGAQLIDYTHDMDPWFRTYSEEANNRPIDPQLMYDYFGKAPSDQQLGEAMSAWNAALSHS